MLDPDSFSRRGAVSIASWQPRMIWDARAKTARRATSNSTAIASSTRNWRCPAGELDLVVANERDLVVVEVKTRRSEAFGHPFEAIDRRKRARLWRLTAAWMAAHPGDAAGATPAHRRHRPHGSRPRTAPPSSTSSTWRCRDCRAHVGRRARRRRGRARRGRGRPVEPAAGLQDHRTARQGARRSRSARAQRVRQQRSLAAPSPADGQPVAGEPAQARLELRCRDRDRVAGNRDADGCRRPSRPRCTSANSDSTDVCDRSRASCQPSSRRPARVTGEWSCPHANRAEAELVGGIEVLGAVNLAQVAAWHGAVVDVPDEEPVTVGDDEPQPQDDLDLADVIGQREAVEALIAAAAGGHHLLMCGPPGAGKTMLARRLPGILPPLDDRRRVDRRVDAQPFGAAGHHSVACPAVRGTASHGERRGTGGRRFSRRSAGCDRPRDGGCAVPRRGGRIPGERARCPPSAARVGHDHDPSRQRDGRVSGAVPAGARHEPVSVRRLRHPRRKLQLCSGRDPPVSGPSIRVHCWIAWTSSSPWPGSRSPSSVRVATARPRRSPARALGKRVPAWPVASRARLGGSTHTFPEHGCEMDPPLLPRW